MMNRWIDILDYRDFHDVPRVFIVEWRGKLLLFDCAFDDELDEYPDDYNVHEIAKDISIPRDWTDISAFATRVCGQIPVREVVFDKTNRRQMNSAILDERAVQ
jgi:hypothetical protein